MFCRSCTRQAPICCPTCVPPPGDELVAAGGHHLPLTEHVLLLQRLHQVLLGHHLQGEHQAWPPVPTLDIRGKLTIMIRNSHDHLDKLHPAEAPDPKSSDDLQIAQLHLVRCIRALPSGVTTFFFLE